MLYFLGLLFDFNSKGKRLRFLTFSIGGRGKMAYRRSIITRAKLLYQEERLAASFTYINNHNKDDDDRRSNPGSSAEGAKIPNFLQNRYFTSGGIKRFGGSRGFIQDPRFSFASQQFMGSRNYGLSFSRNVSSTGGEGAEDKMEYMSDMVDVLADRSVEAVTAAAQVATPAVNEVAVAAADSFFPVAALQYLIDYVHIFTGFNW